MQPYQERVMREKAELDTRLAALSKFTRAPDFKIKVPEAEQGRLIEQESLMVSLSLVLRRRIENFNLDPEVQRLMERKLQADTDMAELSSLCNAPPFFDLSETIQDAISQRFVALEALSKALDVEIAARTA